MNNTMELVQEIHQNFIDYSHEVNSRRAFADARDGLKPGQRACLWEMYVKGYSSSKPHVKSAKIAGGVISDFWPHGDQAIYETFARMSQPWVNNIPEVDWHGANGSIQISGEPASQRYTEARLSKAIEDGLLFNIKKNNVPMKMNFSEDKEWPVVFPAIFPRLLINGCQGIGSTISNHWSLYNLGEVCDVIIKYLTTNVLESDNLYPDYPTGGIIINRDELANIHKTGKGKIVLRAKAEVKGNNIEITEIPYQVYVEPLIDEIRKLIEKDEITGIAAINNKSGKNKLLIEIECDESPDRILNILYSKTSLQKTYNPNQFALVGKTPRLLNLKQYLDIYLQHNFDCIKRENEYELDKSEKRLNIVDGLLIALEDIDNVIALIKSSKSSSAACDNLIAKYGLNELQAKAIVDMRLGKLANVEQIELKTEKKELLENIADYKDIISSGNRQKDIFLDRLKAFVAKYKTSRKTEVVQINFVKEAKEKPVIIPEDVVVVVTESGLVKRVPTSSYRVSRRGTAGVKNGDDVVAFTAKTNTVDTLLVFSDKGKMYRIGVDSIPEGTNASRGTLISNLIKMENEKPVCYTTCDTDSKKFILFSTKGGLVKKTSMTEYKETKRGGIAAIKIKDGDSLVSVSFVDEEDIFLVSKNGFVLRTPSKDLPISSRVAQGVKGISFKCEDEVVACLVGEAEYLAIVGKNGKGKRVEVKDIPTQNRGGKGQSFYKEEVSCAALANDGDKLLITGKKSSLVIEASEIPLLSKTAIGNILAKQEVLGITKV